MSFSIPQVFISSTSEFAEQRKQLRDALSGIPDFDFKPFIYEEEPARSASPEKHCRAMLDASEIVVLILGSKYGSSFPGRTSSIVEWEYEVAKELNKELKGYVRDPPAAPPDPRQADFVSRVRGFRGGSWFRAFVSPPQLVSAVVEDVKRWRLDSWMRFTDAGPERKRWKDRVVLTSCAVVAVATIAGVAGGAAFGVTAAKLGLILLTGVLMLCALGWILRSDVF